MLVKPSQIYKYNCSLKETHEYSCVTKENLRRQENGEFERASLI